LSWQRAQAAAFFWLVARCRAPPPSQPFLPCGAFQPWQEKQLGPAPPVKPAPWQTLQEASPGAAEVAAEPCRPG